MKKYIFIIIGIFVAIISFIIAVSFTPKNNKVLLLNNGLGESSLLDTLDEEYGFTLGLTNDTNSKAMECNEYLANSLLMLNKAYKFHKLYSIGVYIVIDRSLTDKKITSYKELFESNIDCSIPMDEDENVYLLMAIAKLCCNSNQIEDAVSYLNTFKETGHLIPEEKNRAKAPIRIMLDKDIDRSNLELEVISPSEGVLYVNFGILENRECNLDINKFMPMKEELHLANPDSGNVHIEDETIYHHFSIARTRLYRREILGTYRFSGVNGDERAIILLIALMILIPWSIYIILRVNDNTLKKGLILCVSLLLTWLFFRYFRGLMPSPLLLRYIWYFNYVPLTITPALWLIMNIYLHFKGKMAKVFSSIIWVIAISLSVLVLTNDLHGLAFSFNSGLDNFDDRNFEIVFYIICAVEFIFTSTGTVLLIMKNYKSTKISTLLGPIIAVLLILVYIALDFTTIPFIHELDYNLMVTLLAYILIETSLRAGLIQNCGKYVSLFNNLNFEAAIVDKNNEVVYYTKEYNQDIVLSSNELVVYDSKYRKFPMNNGYLVYKEDLKELNKLKMELSDITQELKRNNEALKNKENYTKDYYKLLNEASILNELDSELKLRKNEIDELVREIDESMDKELLKARLARVKVLVSYIKQRYNLYLNSKLNPYMEMQNIALSIRLISTDSKSLGINSGLLCNSMEMIPSELCVIILDCFFFMLENAYNSKCDLFTNINVESGYIVMFGLFDDIEIKKEYLIDKLKELIKENKISMDIVLMDDMKKVIFKIGSDLK